MEIRREKGETIEIGNSKKTFTVETIKSKSLSKYDLVYVFSLRKNSIYTSVSILPSKFVIEEIQRIKSKKLFKYCKRLIINYIPYSTFATIDNHKQSIRSVAISNQGKFLAVGTNENITTVYSLDPFHKETFLKPVINQLGRFSCDHYSAEEENCVHLGSINSVCFSPSDLLLACASYDSSIIVYDLNKLIQKQRHLKELYNDLSKQSKVYSQESINCSVNLIKTETKELTSVKFSPCEKLIFAASVDKTVCIYYFYKTERFIYTKVASVSDHIKQIRAIDICNNLFATCGADRSAIIYEYTLVNRYNETNSISSCDKSTEIDVKIKKRFIINKHEKGVNTVCFSNSGDYVATGSNDKTILIYGANINMKFNYAKLLLKLCDERSGVTCVKFSLNDIYLAIGYKNNNRKIFEIPFNRSSKKTISDKPNKKAIRCFNENQSFVYSVLSLDFSTPYLVIGSSDCTITLYS